MPTFLPAIDNAWRINLVTVVLPLVPVTEITGIEAGVPNGYILSRMSAATGETAGYSVAEALSILMEKGLQLDKVTVSSDGNGSAPTAAGISSLGATMKSF